MTVKTVAEMERMAAFASPPSERHGKSHGCTMFVHPMIGILPEEEKARAYFFLHYPDIHRPEAYLAFNGLNKPYHELKTHDFGQAMDTILGWWNEMEDEFNAKVAEAAKAREAKEGV